MVRGGGYNANHIEYGLVIMIKVIVMAMLHSVIVYEVRYNASHIEYGVVIMMKVIMMAM